MIHSHKITAQLVRFKLRCDTHSVLHVSSQRIDNSAGTDIFNAQHRGLTNINASATTTIFWLDVNSAGLVKPLDTTLLANDSSI